MTASPLARWTSAASEPALVESEVLAHLEGVGPPRRVDPGGVLARAGTRVDRVFVVLWGELELLTSLPRGGKVSVAQVQRGGVVGDVPLLLGDPMPYEVVASLETTVLEVGPDEWIEPLQRFPALALEWMASIARRLDADRRRLEMLGTRSLEAQVALVLLEQQEKEKERVVVRLTHELIADLVGASRQSATRVLQKLSSEGLVESRYGKVVLLDLQRLRERVHADVEN